MDTSSEFQGLIQLIQKSNPLICLLVIDFCIQWIGFIIGFIFKTEKFYDLTGSITYIVLIYLNFKWHSVGNIRQLFQSLFVFIWAVRLGTFLFTRIIKKGRDRRFDKIKTNPLRFFIAWTIQGVWVYISLLPTILSVSASHQRVLYWRDYFGWSIWLGGFTFEVVADYQKNTFRNNPHNKDKFITSGLWSLCRHPNYFGEVVLWFGLYLSASSNFKSWQYISVVCPIFDYLLITYLSGVPPLERYGMKKWGNLPKYKEYIKNTPIFLPFLRN